MTSFFTIASIKGPHGLAGVLKIHSFAESLTMFDHQRLTIKDDQEYTVKWAAQHGKHVLLALNEVNNRTQAEELAGCDLLMKRSDLPSSQEGSYYWMDLIGMQVFTSTEVFVGQLDSIIETGANNVFVVRDKTRETLVPEIETVVRKIDLKTRTIHIDLPEGL